MPNWQVREGRSGDAQVIEENWIGDNYRLGQLSGTVIDIGANIGAFALRAVDLGAKRVLCYEPDPENFQLLLYHCSEEIDAGIITAYNLAVWDGEPVGYLSAGASTTTTNDDPALPLIPSVTLEEILRDAGPVEYLKIDCEGAEGKFIPATPKEAFAQVQRCGVEYHRFPWVEEDHYDEMVTRLSEVFTLDILESSLYGGMLFGLVFGCQ